MRNLYPGASGPVGGPPGSNSHHSRAAAAAAAAGYTHYSHANNLSHMPRYPQVGKSPFPCLKSKIRRKRNYVITIDPTSYIIFQMIVIFYQDMILHSSMEPMLVINMIEKLRVDSTGKRFLK